MKNIKVPVLSSVLAVLFGVGCGGTVEDMAKPESVFTTFTPTANADNPGQAPDRELHSAYLSCPTVSATWTQLQPAWNNNHNTAGTYACGANLYAAGHGFYDVIYPSNWQRTGWAVAYCDNGEWKGVDLSCDGSLISTANSSVCSDSDPVRNMWIGWYLADFKRCADLGGLNWWVDSYNNNAICLPSNDYDGHGNKNACWRAHFRASANLNYHWAQHSGRIAPDDEQSTCYSGSAYPWANVSTEGMWCKYKP